ncbi:hypothetical protein EUX98_g6103 [Antrodiella citrinella]|uniref:Uncharacterized protein n=1 Tax=Antrodiella citrinella TaxID=2447956 RepID=A0A4S4MPU5_9APHY|nr:hypothetical protein EUX98_g6103 [Antrodiella citrinella]
MVFKLSPYRIASQEEPLRTDDVFTTTCVIRDERMEERSVISQAKGEELKNKRNELAEVLRVFQIIEENERNATRELTVELEKTQGGMPHPGPTALGGDDSDASMTSVLADVAITPTDPHDTLSGTQPTLSRVLAIASTPNNSKGSISATWRQKLAALMRETKDVSYVSLTSLDGSDDEASIFKGEYICTPTVNTSKETSRVLGVVTALKTNVMDRSVKWTKKGSPKPKYVGGSSLKKTMPHKARRQSKKPFVPIVFYQGRLAVKRKAPPYSPQGMDIGSRSPFDVRKVSGTSTRLGECTMEPLNCAEAFNAALARIDFELMSPVFSRL